MYDYVPVDAAEAFQSIAQARDQEIVEGFDHWLSHRDRDVNPSVKGKGRSSGRPWSLSLRRTAGPRQVMPNCFTTLMRSP